MAISELRTEVEAAGCAVPKRNGIFRNEGFRTASNTKAFSIYDLLNAPESKMVAAKGLEPLTRGL
jgi:hypothetical protein